MSFIGLWKVYSVADFNAEGMVFVPVEDYLDAPLPEYIDTNDEEAVAEVIADRKKNVSVMLKVCEDGLIYILSPIPEGVSQEEIDEAVKAGYVKLIDNMVANQTMPWELRDGELWFNTGDEIEIMGETQDSWFKASDEDGVITLMSIKYVKA